MAMNEIQGLGLLANVLALPQTIPAYAQAAQRRRQMFQQIPGVTPADLATYAPEPGLTQFPGAQVPVLGSILRGVGTAGQLLQMVLGEAPAYAQGPQLGEVAAIAKMRRDAAQSEYFKQHPETFTKPAARGVLESGGDVGLAMKLETMGPHDAIGRYQADHPGVSTEEAIANVEAAKARARWEGRRMAGVPMPHAGGGEGGGAGKLPADVRFWMSDPNAWATYQAMKEKIAIDTAAGRAAAVGPVQSEAAVDKARKLQAVKDQTVTSATKTMVEAAPKVVHFVDRIERDLDTITTGPMASRYQEFMTGKVGAPNPQFATYRTNVGLLTTLLMRMHVGARGGQEMLRHFTELINAGAQSPENMRAALEAIREYATDVAHTLPSAGGAPATGGKAEKPASSDDRTKRLDDLLGTTP